MAGQCRKRVRIFFVNDQPGIPGNYAAVPEHDIHIFFGKPFLRGRIVKQVDAGVGNVLFRFTDPENVRHTQTVAAQGDLRQGRARPLTDPMGEQEVCRTGSFQRQRAGGTPRIKPGQVFPPGIRIAGFFQYLVPGHELRQTDGTGTVRLNPCHLLFLMHQYAVFHIPAFSRFIFLPGQTSVRQQCIISVRLTERSSGGRPIVFFVFCMIFPFFVALQ